MNTALSLVLIYISDDRTAGGPASLLPRGAALPLHCLARPRRPRDHPVTHPVCQDRPRLHHQDARLWCYSGALQVGGAYIVQGEGTAASSLAGAGLLA